THEQLVPRQSFDNWPDVAGLEVDPAHDAPYKRRLLRQTKKVLSLGKCRCCLHENSSIDFAFPQKRLEIVRREVAVDSRMGSLLEPQIVGACDLPEMLMGIDAH